MSVEATDPPKRKAAVRKPAGRKTVSRFKKYAGGEDSAEFEAAATTSATQSSDDNAGGGITAALAGIAAADGHTVVQIPVAAIAPHPFNDPARSQPQPGNAKWDELVNGARAGGIKVPGLLVTRKAFLAERPNLADAISVDAEYVTIYGHRRRAAALEAALATIPAVVDDSVMVDGGDLDEMTKENLGREDLSEIAEAEMFARYSDRGMGQRAIAEKLGVDQATISRRLSLLLLTPEAQQAVTDGKLSSTEGAALAAALPYGPTRRWQKKKDAEQNSDQRHTEQTAALTLITEHGTIPARAAERVIAEREARKQAAANSIEIIDPRTSLGEKYRERRIFDAADIAAATASGSVVAAIDPNRGELVYYSTSDDASTDTAPSTEGTGELDDKTEAKARTAATKARRVAAQALAASVPGRDAVLAVLTDQYTQGIAATATSAQGWRLAQTLLGETDLDTHEFRAAAEQATDPKQRTRLAWACAVAGYELAASDKWRSRWNRTDIAYLDLLTARGGYTPTLWEQQRLDAARVDLER